MRRNTIASGVLNVAFAVGLVSILAIIVTHALKGWQKGLDSSTTLRVWIELAFILGCMWCAKIKGRKWMWGLLGLFGPLGIVMVACLENKTKNSSGQEYIAEQTIIRDEDQKQVTRKFRLLHWLFWGMVVLQIASGVFFLVSYPAARSISCFMKDMLLNIAFALLAFCVLKGAKWARVFCYVLSVPLLLLTLVFWQSMLDLGVMAICDVWIAEESLSDRFFDANDVLLYMSFACWIVGPVCLSDSKVQKVFAKMKSSSRFGWIWCLLFWTILIYEFWTILT